MSNVSRTASKNWLSLVLIFLFTFSVSLAGGRFVRSILVGNSVAETQEDADVDVEQESSPRIAPTAIDLQPIVDSWVASTSGRVGIIVYDLDRGEIAASYGSDATFSTDDIRGLILAYDGYRQIDNGIENADTVIINGLTYSNCLDMMVRENHTACIETLLESPVRAERITNLLSSLDMTQTTDFGQATTATDLALLLRHVWEHNDLSLSSWAKLQDSMLDQPATDDIDWRQGLPSGFSTARVYDKASGTQSALRNWGSYSDLALVDFVKHDRHFAVVVLSENLTDLNSISRLGTLIEGKVIEE